MVETSFVSERRFTQEEFFRWMQGHEGDLEKYELIDGRIVMSPACKWPQGEASATIVMEIGPFAKRHRLGRVFSADQTFELPTGDTLVPDVAFVSYARWAAAQPEPDRYLRVVPDLVVEILSKSTARRDRGKKKQIYAKSGVLEYWLVDVKKRTVEQILSESGAFGTPVLLAATDTLTSKVLPGFAIAVADLLP